MLLPKNNPTIFCKAFIARELKEYQEKNIWMSYWPVMERLIDRANELTIVFDEIVDKFGYSDKYEDYHKENSYVWLTLEHIWFSSDYSKDNITNERTNNQKLNDLRALIIELSKDLSKALRKQDELHNASGFGRNDFLSVVSAIELGSKNNALYKSYLSERLKALSGQYDLKYWPSLADIVEAISLFEKNQPLPQHYEFPDKVIIGRVSDIKDFVLTFDQKFDDSNGLPTGFRFSNNAVAEIMNIVLNRPVTELITGDAVKNVRNKYKST